VKCVPLPQRRICYLVFAKVETDEHIETRFDMISAPLKDEVLIAAQWRRVLI